jgi:hypothetical protein
MAPYVMPYEEVTNVLRWDASESSISRWIERQESLDFSDVKPLCDKHPRLFGGLEGGTSPDHKQGTLDVGISLQRVDPAIQFLWRWRHDSSQDSAPAFCSFIKQPKTRQDLLSALTPHLDDKPRQYISEQLRKTNTGEAFLELLKPSIVHSDVGIYWSRYFEKDQGIWKDNPQTPLDEEIVPDSSKRRLADFFYSGRLSEGYDEDALREDLIASDYLMIVPLYWQIRFSQTSCAKIVYTRVVEKGVRDLATELYNEEDFTGIQIKQCDFHPDHLRRENGLYLLDAKDIHIGSTCVLWFNGLRSRQLLCEVLRRNFANLLSCAKSLKRLVILGLTPTQECSEALCFALKGHKINTGSLPSLEFYWPTWGSNVLAAVKDAFKENRSKVNMDISHEQFLKRMVKGL